MWSSGLRHRVVLQVITSVLEVCPEDGGDTFLQNVNY